MSNFQKSAVTFLFFIVLVGHSAKTLADPKNIASSNEKKGGLFPAQMFGEEDSNVPTEIESQSLTIDNKARNFIYSGKVHLTHGEMVLTSDFLEGRYNEKNEVIALVARKNVVITKGPQIKASGGKATYTRESDLILLSDSPQLEQDGSVLTADIVKVFLAENRSVAEGQVRVRLVPKKGEQSSVSSSSSKELKK